jgi:hypothetical protein
MQALFTPRLRARTRVHLQAIASHQKDFARQFSSGRR